MLTPSSEIFGGQEMRTRTVFEDCGMAGLAIVMEELFLLRKLALEMRFNIFTTQLPAVLGRRISLFRCLRVS
jgi:hypothetical protein